MQHVLQSIEKQVDYLQMSGDIQCADYAKTMLLSMLCITNYVSLLNLWLQQTELVHDCVQLHKSLFVVVAS